MNKVECLLVNLSGLALLCKDAQCPMQSHFYLGQRASQQIIKPHVMSNHSAIVDLQTSCSNFSCSLLLLVRSFTCAVSITLYQGIARFWQCMCKCCSCWSVSFELNE